MTKKRKESDQEFFERVINKQLEIAGHLSDEVNYSTLCANKEQEDAMPLGEKWFQRYSTTKEKEQEFVKYLKEQFKNRYRLNKKQLDIETAYFMLGWGLSCPNCLD